MIKINIQGVTKTSFIDYPGKICSVVFLGGCNFCCPYCHNPEIVTAAGEQIHADTFFDFLKKRKKYIDGVCVSGGEPTLSKGLDEFMREIKQMGFAIKLDTNGTNPEQIKSLLKENLIDYIAMDIKGPLEKYEKITKVKVNIDRIQQSIDIIAHSGISYEFRTTVTKELVTEDDLSQIVKHLIPNTNRYCIQNFRNSGNLLDKGQAFTPYTPQELENLKQTLAPFLKELIIR